MSTVILDTITGKSTATTITIGSTPVVSASANSMTIRGEGSAQTSIQQGLAKVWVSYEQDDNSDPGNTIHGSFNVSSQTDSATGKTITNFSNNFANNDYSFVGQVFDGGGYNDTRLLNHDRSNDTYSTSALGYYCWDGSSLNDAFRYFGQFMGDLA